MRSILATLTTRLVPALLTAAGVVLVVAGLLSYPNPSATGSRRSSPTSSSRWTRGSGSRRPARTPPPTRRPPRPRQPRCPRSRPRTVEPTATPTETDRPERPEPTLRPGRHVATRVVVPALNIDMPVVKGNDGYPWCNVAMYLHTGNTRRRTRSGSRARTRRPTSTRMPGTACSARSTSWRSPRTAAQDAGHAGRGLHQRLQAPPVRDPRGAAPRPEPRRAAERAEEELWLQTSEGPAGTPGKTQVIARSRLASGRRPARVRSRRRARSPAAEPRAGRAAPLRSSRSGAGRTRSIAAPADDHRGDQPEPGPLAAADRVRGLAHAEHARRPRRSRRGSPSRRSGAS